ncbi:2-oxoacid:ferredoxin oxidoreductase subunit gamma, partial [Candidatus Bathyarchaeota archaeon]|nr:2-oxoacid:ferredoxin oxidoreductase subunit gamma [Candidatus Bathyarchaeota archaeon]NIU81141.1 2-oxoacid:ferredoxin oxidoreductase subunit gamma [Candidatus Bathyarchaeota archaeon]NIV67774.1 2-oxoacid:ferredoxin oxidoreductase subunit gamma [Candidatus Bathyarchaeota archaeon]NIW16407.1 2-oxoacid:ferredoxin oxidoreductase subunit gamma [Candidatus Bathyarchaeota archaeon]NIW34380.1 2-oxoacid:ferredoxin oxidoreductase subunit gamma [Candidatus Bathyarchaeota archaeon]
VAMSQNALDKHLKDLKEGGILLVDEDLVTKIPETETKVLRIPATRIVETELQSRIYANMLILGVLSKINLLNPEPAKEAIVASVPEETKEANLKAFEMGLQL